MRITVKVHASQMPEIGDREFNDLAKTCAKSPDSIWAVRAPNCMQFER
jgi:hypothetical protein